MTEDQKTILWVVVLGLMAGLSHGFWKGIFTVMLIITIMLAVIERKLKEEKKR